MQRPPPLGLDRSESSEHGAADARSARRSGAAVGEGPRPRSRRAGEPPEVFVTDFGIVNGTDEDQLAAAVVKYGPLAIGINAGPMQWYHGGVPFT